MKGVAIRQTLHGPDLGALALHREQQARPNRLAVDQDGARPADSVLAAEMGAGQTAVFADRVRQGLARLNLDLVSDPVDPEADVQPGGHASGRCLAHCSEQQHAHQTAPVLGTGVDVLKGPD